MLHRSHGWQLVVYFCAHSLHLCKMSLVFLIRFGHAPVDIGKWTLERCQDLPGMGFCEWKTWSRFIICSWLSEQPANVLFSYSFALLGWSGSGHVICRPPPLQNICPTELTSILLNFIATKSHEKCTSLVEVWSTWEVSSTLTVKVTLQFHWIYHQPSQWLLYTLTPIVIC